jgi:hypothetical protein
MDIWNRIGDLAKGTRDWAGDIALAAVSLTGAKFRTCRYIFWKHVPDETNVILRFDPTSPTLTEEGLLFPQYISEPVKLNSGNVIKALRSQNLLPPSP